MNIFYLFYVVENICFLHLPRESTKVCHINNLLKWAKIALDQQLPSTFFVNPMSTPNFVQVKNNFVFRK